MSICRACGSTHNVDRPSKFTLEMIEDDKPPVLLAGLCDRCQCTIAMDSFGDGDRRERPISEDDLANHLVSIVHVAARRVAERKSLTRCEVLRDNWFIGTDFYQCEGWACDEIEGRQVCAHCRHRHRRGKPLRFTGDLSPKPEAFLIWATGPEDLIAKATTIAVYRAAEANNAAISARQKGGKAA